MGLERDLSTSLRDPERAAALLRTGVVDGPPDAALARVARLAARLLRCPAAIVCLPAEDEPVFVTASGLDEVQPTPHDVPLDRAFYQYAIAGRADLLVEDAREDERLRASPVVTEMGIVSWAGVPLLDPDEQSFGTLCVVDTLPRHWTEAEQADLRELAAVAAAELHAWSPKAADARQAGATTAVRLTYDAIPVMIWTVTADGTCDYVNARWLEFTGRSLGSELGRGWTDLIHPDDRDAYLEQFARAVARREPLRLEYRVRRNDGQYRWLLDIAVPNFAPGGEFRGLIGCSTDVTDRRQLEQRVVRAERVQAIGQLAGGIAHDFNNLLTGILGHASLLQEESGLSALGREDLSQIERSADRAATLTRQLLAMSRRQVLSPRVLDLNQLVAGCLSTLRRLVERAGADRVDPDAAPRSHRGRPQPARAGADPALQRRPGGDAGRRHGRDQHPAGAAGRGGAARLSASLRPATYVVLQVRDNGRGMDGPALERIFEPFSAAPGAGESAGLGLAPVYGIVKQSGGHIEVASEPGLGTTFTIYFPRHEGSGPVGGGGPARAGRAAPRPSSWWRTRSRCATWPGACSSGSGYTVLAAADAESATAIADRRGGHIHLLVTDMALPHLSGRELAARLSIHRPAIKVLYISGTNDASIARLRLLEPGMRVPREAVLPRPAAPDRATGARRSRQAEVGRCESAAGSTPVTTGRERRRVPGPLRAQSAADVDLRQRNARLPRSERRGHRRATATPAPNFCG